jgi:hypothetical protein
MNPDDDLDLDPDRALATRLEALEASAPGADRPPTLPGRRRHGRLVASMTMAPVLALAVVAATATGAVVVSNLVTGHPGIENPDQPLYGANMECMTPPEAAAFLIQHGYKNVLWQVESGDPVAAAGGKGETTSVALDSPPEHGFVTPGAILSDGRLHMIVDQRVGATGVGACYGQPMP